MKLTSKTHRAMIAMIHLALHDHEGPTKLAEISRNMNISMSYLEQLFSGLRAAGLIAGVKGPGGGYYLGRRADQINIAEIVRIVEDEIADTRYLNGIADKTLSQQLWDELCVKLEDFLEELTLADLMGRPEVYVSPIRRDSMAGQINTMFPARPTMVM